VKLNSKNLLDKNFELKGSGTEPISKIYISPFKNRLKLDIFINPMVAKLFK